MDMPGCGSRAPCSFPNASLLFIPCDGDRLLVDRSIEARNGHIVLAVIPGEGATVEELSVRGSTVRLVPHSPNPAHKPRALKEGEEVLIVGVVTNCIKHFKT